MYWRKSDTCTDENQGILNRQKYETGMYGEGLQTKTKIDARELFKNTGG
jgi:hypothetical protein